MSKQYFLGIDNGGTTTKAAIFDERGTELGSHSVSTAAIAEQPGFIERDMEEMWRANCAVIRGVLEKTGIPAMSLAGVGVCGHGKGLYLWGKDHRPAYNGIISTDNRAYAYAERWKADGTEKAAFARSCQHVMACQPVALLAWLRDNEPGAYGNIEWVFECKDYVRFRLTGEARAELTDYSGANLINLHTRAYDDELLRLFGLSAIRDALPPICKATEIAGHVSAEAAAQTGLAAGTPVIGGMFDIDACALAVGVIDEENICMIGGTWSINEYLKRAPVMDGRVQMNSLFCLPEYYLIEESSATSAGNLEWCIKELLPEVAAAAKASGHSVYDDINAWVASVPPETFVPVFLPFIMASNVHPNAKGSFLGVSANHTRKHLLRSVYEGIAFGHRMHLDRLLATRETAPGRIRLAGGVARSVVWTQMFADIMQLPVETVHVNETGALGCAIAVAAATGVYADIADAARHMCSVAPAVYPNPDAVPVYAKKYALYQAAVASLDGLWSVMQKEIEG